MSNLKNKNLIFTPIFFHISVNFKAGVVKNSKL